MSTKTIDREPSDLLQRVVKAFEDLEKHIQSIELEMSDLETQGMINASYWWKKHEYLYLVHPTDDTGYRKREYIGNDAEKVKAAKDAVERYEAWCKLSVKLEVLKGKRLHAMASVSNILYLLKSSQLNMWRNS